MKPTLNDIIKPYYNHEAVKNEIEYAMRKYQIKSLVFNDDNELIFDHEKTN